MDIAKNKEAVEKNPLKIQNCKQITTAGTG